MRPRRNGRRHVRLQLAPNRARANHGRVRRSLKASPGAGPKSRRRMARRIRRSAAPRAAVGARRGVHAVAGPAAEDAAVAARAGIPRRTRRPSGDEERTRKEMPESAHLQSGQARGLPRGSAKQWPVPKDTWPHRSLRRLLIVVRPAGERSPASSTSRIKDASGRGLFSKQDLWSSPRL